MICCWIVTSRAVVGSSAMSTLGRSASAMAMTTRWRMPPENSCGYARAARAGRGMPTSASTSTVRSSASRRDFPWARSTSAICSPTRISGFSDVIGSWYTIAISAPRTARRPSSSIASTSRPSRSTRPPTISAGGTGCSPITDSIVSDFPQPDSPTRATVSPAPTVKSTPSTIVTGPPSRCSTVVRPRTDKTAALHVTITNRVGGDDGGLIGGKP